MNTDAPHPDAQGPDARDPDTEPSPTARGDVQHPASPEATALPAEATAMPAGDPTEEASPEFVQVEVVNVAFHLPSPSPVVHLRELDLPYRTVHFPIGLAEAQAIALALEAEASPRPTTAELLASVAAASGTDVVAVRLTGTREGTVLAELDLMTPRGHVVLDCRPSDGIALALRQPVAAPILCEASMLDA